MTLTEEADRELGHSRINTGQKLCVSLIQVDGSLEPPSRGYRLANGHQRSIERLSSMSEHFRRVFLRLLLGSFVEKKHACHACVWVAPRG